MLTNTNIKVFPEPKLAVPAPFHQPTSADLLARTLTGMSNPDCPFAFPDNEAKIGLCRQQERSGIGEGTGRNEV